MQRRFMLRTAAAWAVLFFAGSLRADVVHLKSGGRVEGEVSAEGSKLRIETAHGLVWVARGDVESVETRPTPAREYDRRAAELKDADADGHFKLGRWCDQNDMAAQAREEYEQALEADASHSGAHKALGHLLRDGRWMTPEEAHEADGLMEYHGEWLTPEERSKREQDDIQNGQLREQERQVAQLLDRYRLGKDDSRLYAFLMIENFPDAAKVRPMLDVIHSGQDELRALAARELARINDPRSLPALATMVLEDKAEAVRLVAREALLKAADPQAVLPLFVKVLGGARPSLRKARALEAAAEMLQPDDDWVLVEMWREYYRIGGGGPREYIMSGKQSAYVRDFNPQVSTDAIVLDPVVGIVQEVTILDLRLLKTEEYFRRLERQWVKRGFAKAGAPANPAQWAEWIKKHQKEAGEEKKGG